LLALLPVAGEVSALALVSAVCVVLILYEFLRHREERAFIRSRRGAFRIDEAARVGRSR
jgi:hypothetical protein